ncbi:hypothetical protein GCM10023116_29530 [Kistimonas scapharcae]|uniref:ParB-like N-terminal domain-containing protein n=1 Tax=Kistimonas scapharcae TaxID=1036133 RepID=A0ABP8V3J1_9GAMM
MQAAISINNQFNYASVSDGSVMRIPLSDIDEFHLKNVRRKRDDKKFTELKNDISRHGVINGITVRPHPDQSGRVEILAGYGRWEASKELGISDIPATIKRVDDKEAIAIGLSENINREDLSFFDEAVAAQRYVSLYDGDVEEAAKSLGWTAAKVRARLVIMSCAPVVLSALDDGSIKLGHAEILSQFTHKLQEGTLEKIIAEKWTVEKLRERAGKAQRLLSTAKFDVTDCQKCQHNSDLQSGLFDTHVGKAKCGNLPCFKAKTEQWLNEVRKPELEAEYGTVLIAIEKPESDRFTVSPANVGADQYQSGCTGCAKNAVILKDGINNDCGSIIPDQCIDSECHRKCVKAFKDSLKAPKVHATDKPAGAAKVDTAPEKKAAAKIEQKTPKAVIEDYRGQVRQISATHMLNNAGFKLGVMLASICKASGYKPSIDALKGATRFNAMIQACVSLDIKLIQNEINAAIAFMASESADNNQPDHEFTDLMIGCLSVLDDAEQKVIEAWKPEKASLSKLTKHGLIALCNQVGLSTAYDIAHGDNAFEKLAAGSKAEFVKGVIGFKFDWSHHAPAEMLKLIPNKN